jgi:hypothetical protein
MRQTISNCAAVESVIESPEAWRASGRSLVRAEKPAAQQGGPRDRSTTHATPSDQDAEEETQAAALAEEEEAVIMQ